MIKVMPMKLNGKGGSVVERCVVKVMPMKLNGNGGSVVERCVIKVMPLKLNAVFCPGFQKGRVPSEKGTFSAVNGPSKGHY